MNRLQAFLVLGILSLSLAMSFASFPAFATSTGNTGQPNQSCQSVFPTGPLTPQGFNTRGFTNATNFYAGSGQTTMTPANFHAVSQYDVACFQVAQH